MKKQGSLKDYLQIARFDHWIKQLFIVPGIVFAIALTIDINLITDIISFKLGLDLLLGFIATCLIASANYVINEWLDAEFDKYHPTKKSRTALASYLRARYVFLEYTILAALGLISAYFVSLQVLVCCLALLIMGIFYNVKPFRTKEVAYLDVLSESINNPIRLMIGWFIIAPVYLPPITIVLGYWMGGAFLMAAKRYAEYRMINDEKTAALYRKSFEKYTQESLLISAFFYALAAVFFCGIFMIKYKIELLLAILPLCGLFCYYLKISYKSDSAAQKPEKLFKEKGLMIYVLLLIIIFGVLMFINIPILESLLDTTLIGTI